MTNIQDWAGAEAYLAEFENTWSKYRKAAATGITSFSEIAIRDLFQEFSIIQAMAEMQVSLQESRKDRAKLELELTQARLLREYTAGAMNKRMSEVMGDARYTAALESYNDTEDELTKLKGSAKATTIAANALSRELSARLKG